MLAYKQPRTTENTSPKFWIDAIAPPPLRPSKLCCERDDSGGGDLAGRLLPHGQVLHHGHDSQHHCNDHLHKLHDYDLHREFLENHSRVMAGTTLTVAASFSNLICFQHIASHVFLQVFQI